MCHLQEAVQEHGGSKLKLIPRSGIGMCHGHRCAQGRIGWIVQRYSSRFPQHLTPCRQVFFFILEGLLPVCLTLPFEKKNKTQPVRQYYSDIAPQDPAALVHSNSVHFFRDLCASLLHYCQLIQPTQFVFIIKIWEPIYRKLRESSHSMQRVAELVILNNAG